VRDTHYADAAERAAESAVLRFVLATTLPDVA
jgi:hypothetical protein